MDEKDIYYNKKINQETFAPKTQNKLIKKNVSTTARLPSFYQDVSYENNKDK